MGTKSLDEGKLNFVEDGINFVGRVSELNGVKGKVETQSFEPNEPFTITATVIGNYKYVKYQESSYYTSQNINKLLPKFDIDKSSIYYLITHIQKFVSLYDGQQGGYKLNDIDSHIMSLPTKNNQPDFEYMATYIKAIQKLIIKDLVEYTEKELSAYQQVIDTD